MPRILQWLAIYSTFVFSVLNPLLDIVVTSLKCNLINKTNKSLCINSGTNKFRKHSHCWGATCWLFSSARLSGIGWKQQVQMRWKPWGGQRYCWGPVDRTEAEKALEGSKDLNGRQDKSISSNFPLSPKLNFKLVILLSNLQHLRGYQKMLRAAPLCALQSPLQLLVWVEEV